MLIIAPNSSTQLSSFLKEQYLWERTCNDGIYSSQSFLWLPWKRRRKAPGLMAITASVWPRDLMWGPWQLSKSQRERHRLLRKPGRPVRPACESGQEGFHGELRTKSDRLSSISGSWVGENGPLSSYCCSLGSPVSARPSHHVWLETWGTATCESIWQRGKWFYKLICSPTVSCPCLLPYFFHSMSTHGDPLADMAPVEQFAMFQGS